MADWQEEGSQPEIREPLPPQPSRLAVVEDAETMARLYRRLVLIFGVQLLLGMLQLPLAAMRVPGTSLVVALLFPLLALGVLLANSVTAYQLTRSMGSRVSLAWAIAMFVPCVNMIVLLVLSSKAQSWCKRYGIKVGLLGPTRESIEELRRRLMTSPFD
jgi:uncharacterized membrane protein YqjE